MNIDEEGVFASQEAVFLKRAFVIAQEELGPEFGLDDAAKAKLAKIVATVARKRLQSGGGLLNDEDAASVADISTSRFIGLKAD
jgi:hypothetical protein